MSGEPVALLDVNVLLAIGWRNHTQHRIARQWLDDREEAPWATCPMTECGFIRIAANPRLSAGAGDVGSALAVLSSLRERNGHQFWSADISPIKVPLMAKLQGHNQVTDSYLLALAIHRDGVLVSFDRGLAASASAWGVGDRVRLLAAA
ncbi:TA system VapC family ribonuclease toxin [Nevskia sp.]|uniref:TA system VapC family ribonuclease toxin n=1 Tax=Nevskia sp. TaxID=1929292 RepID=UPI0025DD6492|nr:TA system VapC family ribonuclease toxin [Nevskia sp.]